MVLTHTYAQTGIGLCSTVAGSAEFLGEQAYGTLQSRLAQAMEQQKYQRFSLCAGDAPRRCLTVIWTTSRRAQAVNPAR
nr:hypothetical protein KXZ65_06205 [Pectobacterium sp. PL152]